MALLSKDISEAEIPCKGDFKNGPFSLTRASFVH